MPKRDNPYEVIDHEIVSYGEQVAVVVTAGKGTYLVGSLPSSEIERQDARELSIIKPVKDIPTAKEEWYRSYGIT